MYLMLLGFCEGEEYVVFIQYTLYSVHVPRGLHVASYEIPCPVYR